MTGRRLVEAESEFSNLNLAEDLVIKSVYEGSSSSYYSANTTVIRSDGGNAEDNSVANPNINIPRPQVRKNCQRRSIFGVILNYSITN